MKKIIVLLITVILLFTGCGKKEPVKVYIFEAGGCPYCEAEIEYLEGLDSYNKKFVIVKKEAYVDHVDWENGKDYELAVKVANEFNKAGFQDATYQATPFVIISDIYAAASYNTSLEETIEKAYQEGDKDAVSCIEEGNTKCIRKANSSLKLELKDYITLITIVLSTAILAYIYLSKSTKDRKKIIEAIKEKSK